MNQARNGHACTTIRDARGIITTILVAGGANRGRLFKSVELLDVISRNFSRNTGELPQAIVRGDVVAANPIDKSYLAYFVGGWNGANYLSSIYALSMDLTWKLVGDLQQARYDHVALALPTGFLPGC